jgi:hypothetical protein
MASPTSSRSLLLAAAVLALGATCALAQRTNFGMNTDAACVNVITESAYDMKPELFGFHWQTAARDVTHMDVLFSEEWWELPTGWGPAIPSPGTTGVQPGSWSIAPNWANAQRSTSIADTVVLARGRIWRDSGSSVSYGDFQYAASQQIGTLGGDAPDVVTLDDRHRVRFRPLVDHPPGSGYCSDGAAPRGFLMGYVVWSLPVVLFTNPTPDDFLRYGTKHVVDLSTLDFSVPDADGAGGSDLIDGDGARLINPDGAPDTGDEIIELDVCSDDGLSRWYSVQPVVRGSFAYYDGGTSSRNGLPSALVDVDGDTTPDVADILVDGLWEFSDACGLGLGLLYEGGIATSLQPGLGGNLSAGGCASTSCDHGSLHVDGVPPASHEPSALDLRDVRPLSVSRGISGGALIIGWEETLGGPDVLYIGDLQVLYYSRRYSHVPADPCLQITNPTIVAMPTYDCYFLVTHRENGVESSYGRDSFGRERPPSAVPCP